jgi:hypothetical protein
MSGWGGMIPQAANKIRFYHFISGVLATQQTDPLCARCKAYANTVFAMKEALSVLEGECRENDSPDTRVLRLLEEARSRITLIAPPVYAVGQKKTGNCKMPEGVCFVKSSKAILGRL